MAIQVKRTGQKSTFQVRAELEKLFQLEKSAPRPVAHTAQRGNHYNKGATVIHYRKFIIT